MATASAQHYAIHMTNIHSSRQYKNTYNKSHHHHYHQNCEK